MMYELRAIDAWRDWGGWYWNNSSLLEEDIYIAEDTTGDELHAFIYKNFIRPEWPIDSIKIVDDGEIIEVLNSEDDKPILALICVD